MKLVEVGTFFLSSFPHRKDTINVPWSSWTITAGVWYAPIEGHNGRYVGRQQKQATICADPSRLHWRSEIRCNLDWWQLSNLGAYGHERSYGSKLGALTLIFLCTLFDLMQLTASMQSHLRSSLWCIWHLTASVKSIHVGVEWTAIRWPWHRWICWRRHSEAFPSMDGHWSHDAFCQGSLRARNYWPRTLVLRSRGISETQFIKNFLRYWCHD